MLTYPPLIAANPGDPITSEGWNNLVTAIKTLYDALNKPQGTLVFKVVDKADSSPVADAVVSLLRKDGSLSLSASYVGGSVQAYVAANVPLGSYSLVIEAPAFATETRDLEVLSSDTPQSSTIQMTRTLITSPMPDLFGLTVSQAVVAVANASLLLGRIIDTHGNDIPPASIPADLAGALVLNQVPESGALVEPKDPVQLSVSAKVEVKLPVPVPNLMGMTYAEAKAALDAVGLELDAPISGSI